MQNRICIVNRNVDEAEFREKHSCRNGRHRHISRAQMEEANRQGFIEPHEEESKTKDALTPRFLLEWLIPDQVLRYKCEVPLRGLSAKVGEYHAGAVMNRDVWALARLAEVQMRREPLRGAS